MDRGELGGGPAAAEGFDEEDGGVHAAAHDVDVVALVGEGGVLRGDDLEVGVDAADVAVVEDLLGALGGYGGFVLLLGLLGEDAEGGEVVFDLLEGGEDGLAVVGGGLLEAGDGLGGLAAAEAVIEEVVVERGAEA